MQKAKILKVCKCLQVIGLGNWTDEKKCKETEWLWKLLCNHIVWPVGNV